MYGRRGHFARAQGAGKVQNFLGPKAAKDFCMMEDFCQFLSFIELLAPTLGEGTDSFPMQKLGSLAKEKDPQITNCQD